MSKLAKTSLSGKFKNVIFLSPLHEAKFSNLLKKEFEQTNDQFKAFELVQLAKAKNFPFAQNMELQFNKKYHA